MRSHLLAAFRTIRRVVRKYEWSENRRLTFHKFSNSIDQYCLDFHKSDGGGCERSGGSLWQLEKPVRPENDRGAGVRHPHQHPLRPAPCGLPRESEALLFLLLAAHLRTNDFSYQCTSNLSFPFFLLSFLIAVQCLNLNSNSFTFHK